MIICSSYLSKYFHRMPLKYLNLYESYYFTKTTPAAITCSKLKTETLEQGVKKNVQS